MMGRPARSTLFPYTTLFRSRGYEGVTRRHDGTLPVNRREFFALGALGLLGVSGNVPSSRRIAPQGQDYLPGTGPSGKLWDPARAGPPVEPLRSADNHAALPAIANTLTSNLMR